jgi:hypothetical protein
MHRSTTRWTTAVAAAALMALPVAAAAQSTGTTPTQQPPAHTQPQQPTQPPTTQPSQPPTSQPTQQTGGQPSASGQVDQAAAKQHLTEARDSLSQLTSLPEAAKLQGEARNQVSQLISNFNELITAQSNWHAAYEKVDANLTSLVGPDPSDPNAASGTAGAVGTSGTAGTAGTAAGTTGNTGAANTTVTVDPAIRAKLLEFRTHLKMFEQSAGGRSADAAGSSDAMPPANATGSTSNPANPASAASGSGSASAAGSGSSSAAGSGSSVNPTQQTAGSQPPTTAGATGTSGTTGATGATGDQTKASEAAGHAEADKHLDAIDSILSKSKTGTLTKAQTAELKKHVDELRRLISQQR